MPIVDDCDDRGLIDAWADKTDSCVDGGEEARLSIPRHPRAPLVGVSVEGRPGRFCRRAFDEGLSRSDCSDDRRIGLAPLHGAEMGT